MPIYYITETKPAILKWEFRVEANSQDEALQKVMDGEVEAENVDTEEDPFEGSEYSVDSVEND
jgi:hypothetical protein